SLTAKGCNVSGRATYAVRSAPNVMLPELRTAFGLNTAGLSTRHLFIRQQTAVINAIRAHLAEFGIVAPVGRNGVEQLLDVVAEASDKRPPEIARACLLALGAQLRTLKAQILNFDRQIMAGQLGAVHTWHE